MRLPRLLALAGLLALASASALPASAQTMRTERVRFARGASAAEYAPVIARGRSVRYLVGARQGQTLYAEINAGDADLGCRLAVYAPGRSIRAANAAPSADGRRTNLMYWNGTLSRSGDYQVVVTSTRRSTDCPTVISVE